MPACHAQTPLLVVANARHSPSCGCALRQGQEALAFARHEQSSGLFVSGLGLDHGHLGAPFGHGQKLSASECAGQRVDRWRRTPCLAPDRVPPLARRRTACSPVRPVAGLSRVGLGWAAGWRTDTLSGGELQKVAIARALHQQPRLLLADEPTARLDAIAADDVIELLVEVAEESGATLVCVVRDLDLLPRLASRAIALRNGVVVADVAVMPNTPQQLRGMLK